MIPSNFRIEILTIRALLCAIGSKGLKRRGYESVNDKSLSLAISQNLTEKRFQA